MKKLKTIFLLFIIAAVVVSIYMLPSLSFKHGKKYYSAQKYAEAFKPLDFAYKIDKDNSDYRYYYVLTLTNLKPVLKVQKALFEISQSNIDDTARYIAKKKINEWRANVEENIGSNYIHNAPSEKGIIRWDISKFPLKTVLLNMENVPEYYRTEILASLESWRDAVNFLGFEIAEKESDADIVINIKSLPKDICDGDTCQYVAGFTVPEIKHGLLKRMIITLYDKTPDGKYLSDKELFNIVLHETGHALGIIGHSYYEGDLMFVSAAASNETDYLRSGSSFQYLTSGDVNTIKLLYKLIPDISNTPVENINSEGLIYAPIIIGSAEEVKQGKLKEAQAYIKESPMLSGGYIDLGIAYSELGDEDNAIKAFKKAEQLAVSATEIYIACYNLAIQYKSMNERTAALKYAQKAQKINETHEITELILKLQTKR